MNQMSKRLKSRMEGGLVADIQLPDYETRLHILEAKAREKGLEITDDTLELMAQNIRQSIRELEGSLNRVVAYAHLLRNKITPELAAQALENIAAKPNSPPPLSTRLLIEAVADSFQLTVVDLQSKRRDKETARARQVAMYVLKQEMNCSLAQIGEELGGRNPATVTYSCQKVASELVSDSYLQTRLADIQQRIEKSGGNTSCFLPSVKFTFSRFYRKIPLLTPLLRRRGFTCYLHYVRPHIYLTLFNVCSCMG